MWWPFKYVTYSNNDGLANRLRLHCLAEAYSFKTGRRLIVEWQRNEKCFATYHDLFLSGPQAYEALAWPEQWVVRRARYHPRLHDNHIFTREALESLQTIDLLPNVPNRVAHFEPYVNATLHFGSGKLDGYRQDVLDTLKPRPEIARQADAFIASIPAPRIGIHMRLGDFVSASSGEPPPFWGGFRTPVERFIAIAQSVSERLPNASFMLVSDGQDDELLPFTSAINCRRRERTNNRNTLPGVRDALTDLLLLSRCDFIIGTPNSSFNEFASFLGNAPLIVAAETSWQNNLEAVLKSHSG